MLSQKKLKKTTMKKIILFAILAIVTTGKVSSQTFADTIATLTAQGKVAELKLINMAIANTVGTTSTIGFSPAVIWENDTITVKVTFTEKRPRCFWQDINASEYGFWANVNPAVDHPRWSQAHERLLGSNEVVPTQIYNGYGDFVAGLYSNRKSEKLFM